MSLIAQAFDAAQDVVADAVPDGTAFDYNEFVNAFSPVVVALAALVGAGIPIYKRSKKWVEGLIAERANTPVVVEGGASKEDVEGFKTSIAAIEAAVEKQAATSEKMDDRLFSAIERNAARADRLDLRMDVFEAALHHHNDEVTARLVQVLDEVRENREVMK